MEIVLLEFFLHHLFSLSLVCEGPLLSSETVKENISSSDPHSSNNEAITGSPESSQKEAPSDAEAGVHHMKEQLGSGSSDASSNRGRFAAFDVPVSTDARTLQHKFSVCASCVPTLCT